MSPLSDATDLMMGIGVVGEVAAHRHLHAGPGVLLGVAWYRVASGAHTYQRFVQFVMERALGAGTSSTAGVQSRTARLVCTLETVADRVSWARVAIRIRWIALIQSLPPHVRSFLRRLRTILRATMHGFRLS